MAVYILNLVLILLFSLLIRGIPVFRNKQGKVLCIIIGIQLFLTAALRSTSVGGDLAAYIPNYIRLESVGWDEIFVGRLEPGYTLLNKILSVFSTDERLLLVATSGIVVSGFTIFIYKNSRIPWLSLFLFVGMGFYTISLSMLRQAIAITLTLWSIQYVEKRSFIKFFGVVFIAILFHYTAIIFLILYPISKFKVTWGYFISMLAIAFVLSQLIGRFFILVVIEKYYSLYEGQMTGGTGYNMLLLLTTITCTGLLLWKTNKEEAQKKSVFNHMMILACCFQFMALHFGLFARIVMYFSVSMLIFIPNALSCVKIKDLKVFGILTLCGLVFCYFVLIVLGKDTSGILPFLFMWE